MDDDKSRKDIRVLLKRFGVNADEAIIAHLARNESVNALKIRLVLEDLTDYGSQAPAEKLHLEVEGEVTR